MDDARPFITSRMAVGLLIVSALSLLVFLVLSAYAPDLRTERSGSANVLSKSAVGYAGLRILLKDLGIDSFIDREATGNQAASLVVLTPEPNGSADELKTLAAAGARLIVLPKWIAMSDPLKSGWVRQLGTLRPQMLQAVVKELAGTTQIEQGKGKSLVRFRERSSQVEGVTEDSRIRIDTIQTISGRNLEPLIVDGRGKAVLVRVKETFVYILSEPDLLNNQGLREQETALLGVRLIDALRVSDARVAFDLTLNGFGKAPDLLRIAFSPPFLGATLCAILVAIFIAFHAFSRFGAATRHDRVFALGKRALADNTAAVIHLMRREPAMAPRYAQAMLNTIAAQLGASRERAADPRWIDALERRHKAPFRYPELRAEAGGVRDTGGLLRVAAKLHRWRREILHERE